MLAKSCSLFIYYQKGPVGGPGTLLTEGVYQSEVGIMYIHIYIYIFFFFCFSRTLARKTSEVSRSDPHPYISPSAHGPVASSHNIALLRLFPGGVPLLHTAEKTDTQRQQRTRGEKQHIRGDKPSFVSRTRLTSETRGSSSHQAESGPPSVHQRNILQNEK